MLKITEAPRANRWQDNKRQSNGGVQRRVEAGEDAAHQNLGSESRAFPASMVSGMYIQM